jgi:hypothetical protein
MYIHIENKHTQGYKYIYKHMYIYIPLKNPKKNY